MIDVSHLSISSAFGISPPSQEHLQVFPLSLAVQRKKCTCDLLSGNFTDERDSPEAGASRTKTYAYQIKMDETTRLHQRDSMHRGSFWSERTFLEKVLLVLLVIVIAVGITLSIALGSYNKAHCHKTPETPPDICTTQECVKSAAYLISSMNESVDPCEDFFSFACGNYINKTFLLGSRVGRFTKLSSNILLRMKELLEAPFLEDIPEHWNKTKHFYKSCMLLGNRQLVSSKPLKDELEIFGKWPLLVDDWDETSFVWNTKLKDMFKKGYNKDILMKIDVELDLKNSSNTLLVIDQPDLGMPRIFYLLGPPIDYAIKAYKIFIWNCAVLLHDGPLDAENVMKQIDDAVEIEKRLAKVSLPSSERKNITHLYNIMTLEELEFKYGGIPWRILLTGFLPEGVTIKGDEKIWVPVPAVLSEIQIILEETSVTKRQLANYMLYRMVLMSAPDLSHAFVQNFYDFQDTLTGKPFSYPDPWQECVDVTAFYFYYSLSSEYTNKYFKKDTKENVTAVETNIKEALKDQIAKSPWVDEDTQAAALLKEKEMRAIIGYPEDILNDTVLNVHYEKMPVGEIHYENVRNAYKFHADRSMEGLHEEYDKHKWDATGNLLMANAFYSPIRNTITIPVGILQEETYNAEKLNCLNYGSLGMLIGHELTHGFDMTGSQFDEKGNWDVWWTNETFPKFKNHSQCFINQYDSYHVPGTNKTVNGTLTRDENIADTGGVKAAYEAYQRLVEIRGKEKQLPGLSYTPNQLFWLSFASVWCSKETPSHLLYAIGHDEHAPPQYRVRGVVSNLKEFSRDFNCKENSPMNPETKCLLWT